MPFMAQQALVPGEGGLSGGCTSNPPIPFLRPSPPPSPLARVGEGVSGLVLAGSLPYPCPAHPMARGATEGPAPGGATTDVTLMRPTPQLSFKICGGGGAVGGGGSSRGSGGGGSCRESAGRVFLPGVRGKGCSYQGSKGDLTGGRGGVQPGVGGGGG